MSISDTIHERSSFRSVDGKYKILVDLAYEGADRSLPTPESLRTLLAGKQYFDNDYSPTEWQQPVPSCSRFLRCACKRTDCQRCLESRRS